MARKAAKKKAAKYTYRPGTDGVDDTWDIYDPYGRYVDCVRFWATIPGDEDKAEARAKLIVKTFNKGYWW